MPIILDGNVPTVDSNLKIGLKCSCNGKLDYGVVQCRVCAGGKKNNHVLLIHQIIHKKLYRDKLEFHLISLLML